MSSPYANPPLQTHSQTSRMDGYDYGMVRSPASRFLPPQLIILALSSRRNNALKSTPSNSTRNLLQSATILSTALLKPRTSTSSSTSNTSSTNTSSTWTRPRSSSSRRPTCGSTRTT